MRTRFLALLLLLAFVPAPADAAERIDKRKIQDLAKRWFQARPPTRFEKWDPAVRKALVAEAQAYGAIPEGSLEEVCDLLWKAAHKYAPKPRGNEIETPYGMAEWIRNGAGGRKSGLLVGLHGGGEGAGNMSEAAGNWTLSGHMGMYPQGIRLEHDTWNTVHGEAFVLTLIELAKARYEIDPDRVYVAGFSMGGTGSWHMAGRYPDLLAGAVPAHGVFMAKPESQTASKSKIEAMQNGLLPNVRNLPVYFYTGLADINCMPGTFLYAKDRLDELAESDPGGYTQIRFKAIEGLDHSFPPGEPSTGLKWVSSKTRNAYPEKIVWEYAADPFPLPTNKDEIGRLPQYWFYWLHCHIPVDRMYVTATRDGNTFDLSVTLAFPDDFTIYLNPSMIDVEKEVVVRVEGEEVYRGKPQPDLETVLVSLDSRLDRTLIFDRKIKVPEPE